MDVQNKRNFILLGHAQSGKTTLAESLLYFCKATNRRGTVPEGNTASDYSFDEIERKSSVNSSLLYCDYKNVRIQMIDAPGYADFFGEALSGVRAVDSVIIVVDAVSGVEVGTERAWQLAEETNLPCLIFMNKMDKEGADPKKTILDIQNMFSKKATSVEDMSEPNLVEAIAESDDKLLEKYLEGAQLSPEELNTGLRQAVIKRKAFPIISGSAATDKGNLELLEAILKYLPSPSERVKVEGKNPAKPEDIKEVALKLEAPFSAFVFKSISDPYVGQLTLLRVFSGSLLANTGFYNVNKKTKERIGPVYILQGKEQRVVESASCGDIVAIAKLKEFYNSSNIDPKETDVKIVEDNGFTVAEIGVNDLITHSEQTVATDANTPDKKPRKKRADAGKPHAAKIDKPESTNKVRNRGQFFVFEVAPLCILKDSARALDSLKQRPDDNVFVVRGTHYGYERKRLDCLKPIK